MGAPWQRRGAEVAASLIIQVERYVCQYQRNSHHQQNLLGGGGDARRSNLRLVGREIHSLKNGEG